MYTLPLLAGYSAAKSYIEKFSRAIHAEYARQGITCQCQIPFYVATKLAKMRELRLKYEAAVEYSRAVQKDRNVLLGVICEMEKTWTKERKENDKV